MKPKPNVTEEQLADLVNYLQSMVGRIPGLRSLKAAKAHPSTAHRAQSFSMGVIAVLDTLEDLQVYTDHPVHAPYVDLFFTLPLQIVQSKQTQIDGGSQQERARSLTCDYQ